MRKSIFKDSYRLATYPRDFFSLIIDIGAGDGDFALWANTVHPDAQVIAIEAHDQAFKTLCQRSERTGIKCIHAGLGKPHSHFHAKHYFARELISENDKVSGTVLGMTAIQSMINDTRSVFIRIDGPSNLQYIIDNEYFLDIIRQVDHCSIQALFKCEKNKDFDSLVTLEKLKDIFSESALPNFVVEFMFSNKCHGTGMFVIAKSDEKMRVAAKKLVTASIDLDFPKHVSIRPMPKKDRFLLFTHERSGSHWSIEILNSHPQLFCAQGILSPFSAIGALAFSYMLTENGPERVFALLRELNNIYDRDHQPSVKCGFLAMHGDLPKMPTGKIMLASNKVILQKRISLAAAVSYYHSKMTSVWYQDNNETEGLAAVKRAMRHKTSVSPAYVNQWLKKIRRNFKFCLDYLNSHKIDHIVVDYNDMLEDSTSVSKGIYRFLGVDVIEPSWNIAKLHTHYNWLENKDELNERFGANYGILP